MYARVALSALVLILVAISGSFAEEAIPECERGRTIWKSEKNGVRTVAYYPDTEDVSEPPLVFEGWRKDKIEWRVTGRVTCTLGVSMCYARIPLLNGDEIEVGMVEIEEGSKRPYLVMPNLLQETYYVQTRGLPGAEIKAEWLIEKPSADGDPAIVLPSYLRAIGCRN